MASISPINNDEEEDFGDLDLSDLEDAPQKDGKVVRSNFDLNRYRAVLTSIPQGKQRKWYVPTGELYTQENTNNEKRWGRGKLEYQDQVHLKTAAKLLDMGVYVQFLGHVESGERAGKSILRVVPLERKELAPVQRKLGNYRLAVGRLWDAAETRIAIAKRQQTKEAAEAANRAKKDALDMMAERACFIQADRDGNLAVTEVPDKTNDTVRYQGKNYLVTIKEGVQYKATQEGTDEEGRPVFTATLVQQAQRRQAR